MNGRTIRTLALAAAAAASLGACASLHLGNARVLPAVRCEEITVTLYFNHGQDDVVGVGRQIIKEAAKRLKSCPVRELRLVGLADMAGSSSDNIDLSRRRAERVRDAFIAAGVKVHDYAIVAAGDVGAVQPSGAVEPVRRRVDVTAVLQK